MSTPQSAQQIEENTNMSSTNSPAASIEPLHQLEGTPADSLEEQRRLLQQKLAEQAANAEKFSSPTDSVMSPCSQKLAAHKKKQYGKSKPTLLKSAFAQVAASQENRAPKQRDDTDESPF
ncbi:hypothetical protein DRE_03029 [Drechslerella stenobrocha 248]|uniref:Spo12-like protein n=1 Tax=Drechslerella stenobrocha 248 TaxID=1043628 RepID=W7HWC0_9PEZI|nr:hypothetical protein DRE_03029 [Drechslerella stenobrocha 248]